MAELRGLGMILARRVLRPVGTWGAAACVILACGTSHAGRNPPEPGWPQWGGPQRDFRAPAGDLAETWPTAGPPRLWSRPLGAGYAAILYEDGRLYTTYRDGADEVVVCLDAGDGRTIWEHRYAQAPRGKVISGYGVGPRSTPLIAGKLVFSVGVAGKLVALHKKHGRLAWSRDLWDAGGTDSAPMSHGYAPSPVAYGDSVIVAVDAEPPGLLALDRESGRIQWRARGFKNGYGSPRVLDIAGEPQLLVFAAEELLGLGPGDGRVLWRFPHANQWGHNIHMPAVLDGDTIFISSPQAGARGLRLIRGDGGFHVQEVWSSRRIQFYHVTSVRDGDWVYGSSGMMSPAFMTALNARTGEVAWRERGFAKANCVASGDKLLILDEDGSLALASATPDALTVHARAQLLDGVSWTVPTLVNTTLYVRDNRQIMALDLGASESGGLDTAGDGSSAGHGPVGPGRAIDTPL